MNTPKHNKERTCIVLLSTTLFISSVLLFWIQPLFGKTLLPLLGGSPAVWNTCMVFFQTMLLLGYFYSFLLSRRFSFNFQVIFHVLILLLTILVWPVGLPEAWAPNPETYPYFQILGVLFYALGLPTFILSATAPLVQNWLRYTDWPSAKDPYFLYSASNLGCLGLLLLYPFLIEPNAGIATQFWLWNAVYLLFIVFLVSSILFLWRTNTLEAAPRAEPISGNQINQITNRIYWVILSMIPAAYLYGVTTYITTDIASAPLLWVLPLALYLSTFVIAFARRTIIPFSWTCQLQPALILPVVLSIIWNPAHLFVLLYPLHLLVFFISALMCHQRLAHMRPPSRHLTEFYLWLAFGGVFGGLFSTLGAPVLFSTTIEYPLILVAVCFLRPTKQRYSTRMQKWNDALIPGAIILILPGLVLAANTLDAPADHWAMAFIFAAVCALAIMYRQRTRRFGFIVGAIAIVSILTASGARNVLLQERNFFGTIRVSNDPARGIRTLVHGHTTHGAQHLETERELEPLTYYYKCSPIWQIFEDLTTVQPQRVGIMGLGVGTLLLFGEEQDHFTFYEIDPAIYRIAQNPRYFTYFENARPETEVVIGDARLSLKNEPDHTFDMLIMDAFTSDAIPTHLITKEAMELYIQKLKTDGILAVHISNRYLDLEPVLATIAKHHNLAALIRDDYHDEDPAKSLKYPTTWVVMAHQHDRLTPLIQDKRWRPPQNPRQISIWTDDYTNLLDVLKWDLMWQ